MPRHYNYCNNNDYDSDYYGSNCENFCINFPYPNFNICNGGARTLNRIINIGRSFVAIDNNNNLLRFSLNNLECYDCSPIIGIDNGQIAVGTDFRPATGQLYLVAKHASVGQLYLVNFNNDFFNSNIFNNNQTFTNLFNRSVIATKVGLPFNISGTFFGVNFNPTVDRLRVNSNLGQNLRINPNTGEVTVDTPLAYAVGDPNFGAVPSVVSASYTNSVAGATTTTLYVIDSRLNILATQNPANDGTLNTIGQLGINIGNIVGFDIEPGTNVAYATFIVNGVTKIYTINLATGRATFFRSFCRNSPVIRGLTSNGQNQILV